MNHQETNTAGGDEIRRLLQDEVMARIPLLLKYTSSAGLRLQVPDTDIQIIAGPQAWIASQSLDAATDGCAQREDGNDNSAAPLASQSQPSIKPWRERVNLDEYEPKRRDSVALFGAEREIAELRAHLAGQSQATKVQAVPDILFDGKAVYDEVLQRSSSTSAYHVANVLDAVVRILRRSTPTAQEVTQQAAPTAWLATDLDGRGDVAFTKEEAKRRAGEGCTEVFPLHAIAPVTQQAAKAETSGVQVLNESAALRKLAFRTLWLAYVWNDHNFNAAHLEARRTCEALGIHSFDEANAWLEAINNRSDLAPTTSTVSAPSETQLYLEWSQLMDALECDDTESALAKIKAGTVSTPEEARNQALEAIANDGLDARQCMELARRALRTTSGKGGAA